MSHDPATCRYCQSWNRKTGALAAAARKSGDGTAPGEAPQSGGESRNAQTQ